MTTLNAPRSQNRPSSTTNASPASPDTQATLHVAIPKGRMYEGVVALLAEAGIRLSASARGYRPTLSLPGVEAKILKPQNIIEMLEIGSRDVGFAGADWVAELGADVVEVLDTGLDRVRVVAAAPRQILEDGRLPRRPLVVASEMERLTRQWIATRDLDARFVRSYGATEVFPPEDADCIVDIAASGATLAANGLEIVDELLSSSTRLYASRAAMADDAKRATINDLALLLSSVLEARKRIMLEVNVPAENLDAVVAILPCMRQPTISPLHAGTCSQSLSQPRAFAVKAAVPRDRLPRLIPAIKQAGGTDLVISPIAQVVP
ncbi:MAG: ATP phosphoribosyltransferase [Phycisphaeraceae bacterium]|nr:ATP phosphoribosyltransferase [Phycisphaeraceae bacterium]